MNKAVEKYREQAERRPKAQDKKAAPKAKLVDGLTKDEIVVKYASLVKYLAQKIAIRLPANIELDDLISAGVIGLMDACDKYDCTRDNKFKTYAEFRIRGAMLDELRAQDWVPRSVREKAKQLERVYAKIEQEKGRPATDPEVCEVMKITPEEYADLLAEVRSVSLINYDDLNSLARADKKSLVGLVENGKMGNPFAEVSRTNLKSMVEKAIAELPEKQRLVLALYYYEEMNLKEIGRVLEVTESRVSQLHTQAVLRLKTKLKSNWDEFVALIS
ncbi:MAG: FliA/WhiG family RNA polymerase sigma factor [Bdellovibrionales bacterium]|nr:FliA/WhiG family RNA polymerase sigma factor [Bdellovibrionales bacterium]